MSDRPASLRDLLAGIAELPGVDDIVVQALALDSRAVRPGALFIALAGGAGHGIAHARAARDAGAVAVLADDDARVREVALDIPVVPVPGLRAKLGELANRFHDRPSDALSVTGVTGTNGKTSTVQLIAGAFDAAGLRAGSIGTLGAGLHGALVAGERTTPDVLATHALLAGMRDDGARRVAMEVSSHALDQGRVDGVAFRDAVFTNLTRDHLDYHGDMDAYGAAKARLFRDWPLRGAVINADDAYGGRLLALPPRAERVLSTSAAGRADADLHALAIRTSMQGLEFELVTPWGRGPLRTPLVGRFNVANLLSVAAVLGLDGWPFERIVATLPALAPVPGRMNRLGGDGRVPLVVVDYAHTPDALEQALSSLRAHAGGDLVCVFGCGGERDAGKRPQMGAIAERLADRVVITDDNPRGEDGDAIVAQIRAGLREPGRARVERDRARAIALAIAGAGAQDVVLIAGKGHEPYQEVAGQRRPFDDLAESRRVLEARA